MVVEIGGGSVAWGASTAQKRQQSDDWGQNDRIHLQSTMASTAQQSKENIRPERIGLGWLNARTAATRHN
jgi:hypothetical protein